MPPKVKFTRGQIVEAAFEIARVNGLEGITIRRIAATLGCSIAPVYVNFAHIHEVRRAVVERTIQESRRILADVDTGNPFRDIGVAAVRFARDYPVIFRELVLKPNPDLPAQREKVDTELVAHMKSDPELTSLPEGELRSLLLKMQIFHAGLSTAVVNGLLPPDTGEEEIINLINDTAGDLITSARLRSE